MPPASTRTRTSRSRQVAEHLKELILRQGLRPGDRLPSEAEMMAELDKSKGTVREAMRLLEAEGLIRTRTGPGGGAFVAEPGPDHAADLLANFFYFRDLSIDDLYQIRLALEPELAASVAGKLSAETLARFRAETARFDRPPESVEEERAQHVASLDFHRQLAAESPNPLLGFIVGFIARVLSDLTVFRQLYAPHNLELWRQGHEHHSRLLAALEAGDAEAARATMRSHMETALRLMRQQEAAVARGFLGRGAKGR